MLEFDSNEEIYFSWYLDELLKSGFIRKWKLHPITFELSDKKTYAWNEQLKTKVKIKEQTLFQPHNYTPDFLIEWTEKARSLFFNSTEDRANLKNVPFISQKLANEHGDEVETTIIDIKPTFDQNNMTRLFSINQKWVYDKLGVYVQKIIPLSSKKPKVKGLFEKTFVPTKYLLTDKSKKARKINFKIKQLKQFLMEAYNV